MPRKGAVPKRQILPDPRFNSKVLARFINKVMLAGKKSVAERITYDALTIVQEKLGRDPMDVFTQALGNAMPLVEVRPRRVGGATYQVPMEVRPDRRQAMAMRWLLTASVVIAPSALTSYSNLSGCWSKALPWAPSPPATSTTRTRSPRSCSSRV